MSHTKNRVQCVECNKPKLLFATKKEAELFIKFNADNIKQESGYAPIRAYYCRHCGGWHVTSKESQATSILKEVDRHLIKLQKYITKNDICKAKMEYMKAFRFLSEAAEFPGENVRKQIAIDDLTYYNKWLFQQSAA